MATPLHLVIMGVSGSGKTVLAEKLAERLGWPYAEADDFHPQANIDKMAAGHPLTDEDRWPWLRNLRDWMDSNEAAGESSLVTCSALKRSYRDLLRTAAGEVSFVHVAGSPEVIAERLQTRAGHFFPPSLLPTQFATLEELAADEPGITVDNLHTPDELADEVIAHFGLPAEVTR